MTKSILVRRKWIWIVLLSLVLVGVLGVGGWHLWLDAQPKFHDHTIELGTQSISLRDFMTEYAKDSKVSFVTDPAQIDLNQAGTMEITLRHGRKDETVTLTVQDTTLPQAQFVDRVVVYANQQVPSAQDLVTSVTDYSPCTITYLEEPEFPKDYQAKTVTILVTDASGNQIQGQSVLNFRWLLESYTMELGDTLTKENLLLNPQRDIDLLDQAQFDTINQASVGQYTVSSVDGSVSCDISVVDTTPPELELQDVERLIGRKAVLSDFVVGATDLSGIKEIRLKTELVFNKEQTYPVVIEAEDYNGNITTKEATLSVIPDRVPPYFHGNLDAMLVEKHSTPDFVTGVKAYDDVTGECEVTCDPSRVDLTKAGVYYVYYTAKDKNGNVGTHRRRVEVEHDQEDTNALVKQVAAKLSRDAEEIRNYVRNSIRYSSNSGGDDPVWYGLTQERGNCYVYCKTFQALLRAKGYETQTIHTTCRTHYWVLVKLNGKWVHMDATPGNGHSTYSIMNDEQRYSTLKGRDWDREKWPECP